MTRDDRSAEFAPSHPVFLATIHPFAYHLRFQKRRTGERADRRDETSSGDRRRRSTSTRPGKGSGHYLKMKLRRRSPAWKCGWWFRCPSVTCRSPRCQNTRAGAEGAWRRTSPSERVRQLLNNWPWPLLVCDQGSSNPYQTARGDSSHYRVHRQ